MKNLLIAAFLLMFGLAPALAADDAGTSPPIKVVASFSLLGDMAAQIGGERIALTVLCGAGQDAHDFTPAPSAVKALSEAEIIIINGLNFEPWIGRLIHASKTKAKLLVASAGVEALSPPKPQDDNHDFVITDPHAWQNLGNGALYVKNIFGGFAAARPLESNYYKARAKAYQQEILALHEEAKAAFSALTDDKRTIVTTHDAFGYFADAYGLKTLSPMGINAESEPSAAALAAVIKSVKETHARALFAESGRDTRLLEQIARETGARLGGTLYADTLTTGDGEAPTYLAMMKLNIARVKEAVR